ncbi:MAG: hypothetical protein GY859_11130 [Desulfobacterales bacterium]|nr:hypothetical protein [Desulfobacterales bacterium]
MEHSGESGGKGEKTKETEKIDPSTLSLAVEIRMLSPETAATYSCNGHRLRFQNKAAEHGVAALNGAGRMALSA